MAQVGIKEKLIYAEALINIYWMKKNSYSCRNKIYYCHIPHPKIIGLYANKLPFCSGSTVVGLKTDNEDNNLTASVACANGSVEKYYFRVRNGEGL